MFVIQLLFEVLDVKDRLIVVIDAEYVHEKNIDESKIDISSLVDKCLARSIKHISVNSSSFPSSVKSRIGGGDKEGVMKILELAGISTRELQVYQIAAQEEAKNTQQEKS